MIVRLLRLHDHGRRIPRYQHSFNRGVPGELVLHSAWDPLLEKHSPTARLLDVTTGGLTDVPPQLDVRLELLTREQLRLSGIERVEALAGILEFAQTWICWLDREE